MSDNTIIIDTLTDYHQNSIPGRVDVLELAWTTNHKESVDRYVTQRQHTSDKGQHIDEAEDNAHGLRKYPGTFDYCEDCQRHVDCSDQKICNVKSKCYNFEYIFG